jgi:rRNA maturation RNase YbeY
MRVDVDAMVEGSPHAAPTQAAATALLKAVQSDCEAAVRLALAAKKARAPRWPLPSLASVSLVLCDDAYIRALNAAHRGVDAPTDVLSFEVPDEPGEVPPPVKLLGDLVVSLDTAARQAAERGHTLEDELRVLLVHGALHLCGFDHERGPREMEDMAAAEAAILAELGWRGAGLIEMATSAASDDDDEDDGRGGGGSTSTSSSSSTSGFSSSGSSAGYSAEGIGLKTGGFRSSGVRLVALDMDGTLLDSKSRILPSSVKAIRAALDKGVRVVLATGKARPAAVAACEAAGLAGARLDPRSALVSRAGPGVFLQGLAVHGADGAQLSDASLPTEVVRAAFEWAAARDLSLAAFHGDTLSTLALTPALEELHTRYYEPLPVVEPSLDALLAGPPVRKLLFMDTVERIAGEAHPHWAAMLAPRDSSSSSRRSSSSAASLASLELAGAAELLQAVPDMLEVVPVGVNKWVGVELLLRHLGVSPAHTMAVGDGGNDTQMVANAGLGIAMANGVAETRAAAAHVVASNDDGGIAEAFERFLL